MKSSWKDIVTQSPEHIFFDLDGTLLGLHTERFMELYIGALVRKFTASGRDGAGLTRAVMKATYAMFSNDGSRTNAQAFWETFSGLTGVREGDIRAVFEEFYTSDFSCAKAASRVFGESAEIVRVLKEKGYRLYLTTNAVFPREAVEERCRWAGISIDDFCHVTTYDNSHFCKPNPGYYREVLQRFGLRPQQVLMIGNDREEDCAAEECGISCILTEEELLNAKSLPLEGKTVMGHGELLEFARALPVVSDCVENR